MTAATKQGSGLSVGIVVAFLLACIVVIVVARRPSRPPHTPRPPAGPTNIRPATHAPHR